MAEKSVTAPVALYQCKTCERELQAGAFYASNQSRCKDCVKKSVRENRTAKADYYRDYDRKRYQEDPRVKQRHNRYRNSEKGKESFSRAREKWKANNPEKRAAQVEFGNAIRGGRVERETQCRLCGVTDEKMDAHHFDYSKPLEVTWLCHDCHAAFHQFHGPMEARS